MQTQQGELRKTYSHIRKIELEYTEADDFQVDREGDSSSDNCDSDAVSDVGVQEECVPSHAESDAENLKDCDPSRSEGSCASYCMSQGSDADHMSCIGSLF